MSIFSKYLSNGSGKSAVGDYSSSPEVFKFTAEKVPKFVHRMIISIEDGGSFDSGKYGNSVTLTNGILVQIRDAHGTIINDLTDQIPIKTNSGWGHLCYDVSILNFGSGNEHMVVRWTFAKAGKPIYLNIGDSICVIVNDNFTDLVDHKFLIQGCDE